MAAAVAVARSLDEAQRDDERHDLHGAALSLTADLAFAAPIERIGDEFPPKRASKKSSRANHGRKPMGKLFDHYRPELHYMRGPGPRWLAKHGRIGPTGQIASEDDNNASKLVEAGARRRVSCRPRIWMRRSRVDE